MKRCVNCGLERPLDAFHKARQPRGERPARGGMGVASKCKSCVAELRKPGLTAERALRAEMAAAGKKCCSVCAQWKQFSEYSARAASPDGLSYKCRPCFSAYARSYRKDNPGSFAEWEARNLESRKAYNEAWREKNKEVRSEYMREWARTNAPLVNAKVARRVARRYQATPKWADEAAIVEIYARAKELTKLTGVRHEVDHFYPLQGKLVCGLHCEANLQILTKTENIRKLNRMPEEVE